MKEQDYEALRQQTTIARWKMCEGKSKEYTIGSDDRLANFKRIGERMSMPSEQVLMVYFLKHIDSITAFCAKGIDGQEGIDSRIDDAQNYLDLLRALVHEKRQERTVSIATGEGK